MKLLNKTALVTGGSSGIGLGIAVALANEGCRVAIAGRREEALREAVASYSGQPALVAHTVDVADEPSVNELFRWADTELGRIDILVNSAGMNVKRRSMAELSPEDWRKMLDVNTTGAYYCMRAVLPQMRERRDGLIVNISSISGIRPSTLGGVGYSASKFALSTLGLTVAREERDNGIRISTIYPGEVDTPILDHRPVEVTAEQRLSILQPEDIGAAVVMIATLPPRAHVPELVIKPTNADFA